MSDMGDSDSNILARIDERTKAQAFSFAQHLKDDQEKFDKIFTFVSKGFDKMDNRFDAIDKKMEPLQIESNQRKGAFSASRMIAGGVWAAVVLGVDLLINGHHP